MQAAPLVHWILILRTAVGRQIKKIGVCWRSGFRENPQSIDRWTLDEHALRTLGALENVVLGDLQHGDTERLAESEVRVQKQPLF